MSEWDADERLHDNLSVRKQHANTTRRKTCTYMRPRRPFLAGLHCLRGGVRRRRARARNSADEVASFCRNRKGNVRACVPVGVRGCLSAEVECDGAALASSSVSKRECAARMCGGSQAHPLPSCAPVVARLAVHARSRSMAPNERSRARTMANAPLARRLRDESGSPCRHTVIKHAFGRQKSPAWRFRSGSRLGRRTPRSGMRPVHDLR